jgi:3D (Asp-Asp-Asp) domain-containing protein
MHLKKSIKSYILYFALLALAGAIIVLVIMTQISGKEQKKTAKPRLTLTAEISKEISSVECSEACVEPSVSIVPTVTEQVVTQDTINDTADSDVPEEMNIVEETEEVSSADIEEIPVIETTEEIYTESYDDSYGGSLVYLGDWTITYYCACEICCGEWASGYTASGTLATEGITVACGSLPMGTQIYIDGIGYRTVEDTGVNGEWIDVFVNSHEAALQGGMYTTAVYLVQ